MRVVWYFMTVNSYIYTHRLFRGTIKYKYICRLSAYDHCRVLSIQLSLCPGNEAITRMSLLFQTFLSLSLPARVTLNGISSPRNYIVERFSKTCRDRATYISFTTRPPNVLVRRTKYVSGGERESLFTRRQITRNIREDGGREDSWHFDTVFSVL